jgi:hypothetical protein
MDPLKAIDNYDVFMGISPSSPVDQIVFALIKLTYSFKDNRLSLAAPAPLFNNIFDPEEDPRLKPGTDYWPIKAGTDIALQGKAVAPGGRPVRTLHTAVQVGSHRKEVAVFGPRTVSCPPSGRVRFSEPEPFEQMDLTYQNAYGGIDWRVPVEEPLTWDVKFRLQADHPGLYPRNHFGKGYVVLPDPTDIDGIALPNLENPRDLLTEERLITGDPRDWHLQPIPWCFDWMPVVFFHRCAFFCGVDGWYPAPEGSVREVEMGLLPKNYRTRLRERFLDTLDFDAAFFSEASPGLAAPFLKGNEPVILQGFHPDGEYRFNLPGAPAVELFVEGARVSDRPQLHSVLFSTEEEQLSMLWGIWAPSPRPFVPGIHETIPIACRVNGGPACRFEAPPPVEKSIKEQLARQAREAMT